MITYDYHCDANGETLTVSHSIKETLMTWGDLCSLANHHMGNTPPFTPIRRLISCQECSGLLVRCFYCISVRSIDYDP